MRKLDNPDLTFPMVLYGPSETPWDLTALLYRGGAVLTVSAATDLIFVGSLGSPIPGRLPLVVALHEVIAGHLAGGGSRITAKSDLDRLCDWFAWVDKEGRSVSLETAEDLYIAWTDHLLYRHRVVGAINELTVYSYARTVARLLDEILDNRVRLLSKTRVRKPTKARSALGIEAEKQNLEQTFAFGHALLDTVDGLSVEAIRGPLPIRIQYRSGQIIEDWCRLRRPDAVGALTADARPDYRRRIMAKREAWSADTSLRTRSSLVNLRIESELLIFIAQTGMNLTQAQNLKTGQFRYQSHLDGYHVYRVYKGRRQGEVEFDIYREYKAVFERYLAWRDTFFPVDTDHRLFPYLGERASELPHKFWRVRSQCQKLGIRFIPSGQLRQTRINWMLRRSLDPELAAEMHQHSKETLIRHYEKPHLQTAMIEVSRFHTSMEAMLSAPGPGVCVEAVPQAVPDAPPEAPVPDCIAPAGCLFCQHQRDIDSEDHVWSLASYRQLKTLELARYRPPAKDVPPNPAEAVIDRATAKLKHFEQSSEVRALWVRESLARVDEGDYHPNWDGFLRLMERI